jgi:hypothetical protein
LEKLIARCHDLELELQSATSAKKLLTLEKASWTKEKAEMQQQLNNYKKVNICRRIL